MNFGVPWSVAGIRPDARETAKEAARRSGMSVGEWLNSVIDIAAGANVPVAQQAVPRPETMTARDAMAGLQERLDNLSRQIEGLAREAGPRSWAPGPDEAQGWRFQSAISQFDERLERLMAEGRSAAEELDRRLSAFDRARSSLAPAPAQHEPRPAAPAMSFRASTRTAHALPPAPPPGASPLDQALAEIAARQRALDGEAPARQAPPAMDHFGEAAVGRLAGLERQLQQITSQIESLARPSGIDEAINALRADLAQIGRTLADAMPRRALEALDAEIKALARRLDAERRSGADTQMVAGIERGLAEVRDALRGLTPAENLAGFDAAVRELGYKIDQIAAAGGQGGHDPAALQQIEQAISGLRSMVTHVASGDALGELAAEVRALAAKIDISLSSNSSTDVLRTLDQRISAIADAIEASRHEARQESGRTESPAVSPELDSMLKSLTDKLERVQNFQLSRGEQVAFGHFEERIAKLIEKLDASEGRLGHLEAIERGMADLLVHLDEMRSGSGLRGAPAPAEELKHDLDEIRQSHTASERRTTELLEAVHDTIGNVVDRLAMIEGGIRSDVRPAPAPVQTQATAPAPLVERTAAPVPAMAPPPLVPDLEPEPERDLDDLIGRPSAPPAPEKKPAGPLAQVREPIDPTLPPDFPLEPGSGPPRGRAAAGDPRKRSAAARIAASEAVLEPGLTPGASGQTSNFIAAARRAAKTAVGDKGAAGASRTAGGSPSAAGKSLFGDRLKSILVAASVVVIVFGVVRVALNFFESDDGAPTEQSRSAPEPSVAPARPTPQGAEPERNASPPAPGLLVPEAPAAAPGRQSGVLPQSPAMVLPVPAAGVLQPLSSTRPALARPAPTEAAPPPADITGSVPPPQAAAAAAPLASAPIAAPPTGGPDGLPTTIGGAPVRTAALDGDPAAAYEIATRYAEGRGVPISFEEAARWFERAAKAGLAPAQFRLGSLYEKGQGVKKNLDEARRLYIAAADKGNAKAMHNLAVLYAEGVDNGKPDYKTAAQWFRKAADHDVPDSQYNLGVLYARGIGVEQNLLESYKWFTLAARHGDKDSGRKRDDVGARLDAQSLMAAKLAVQTWVADPQPDEAVTVKAPAGGWDVAPARAQPAKPKQPRSNKV
jgi:localization factor PodJL